MMQGKIFFSVLLIIHIYGARTGSIPFITKCRAEDLECLKQSAQAVVPVLAAGIPEYKIQPLDPLYIDKVDGSSPNLNFTSTDVIVTGLKNCIIEKVVRDAAKLKIDVTIACDTVTFKSRYVVHGRVLIVPFEGDGDMVVVLRKYRMHVYSDLVEKLDKQGRKHWQIKNYKYNYELNGKSDIDMSNLFEGNEILSRAARQLISTSSNEVVFEVGPPINKAIVEKIIKAINQFYHATAVDDLVLD